MSKFQTQDGKKRLVNIVVTVTVGCAVGFINGFFGGGGGMLLVPLLGLITKLSVKQSHATAIAVILPLSILSAVIYYIKGVDVGSYFTPTAAAIIIGGAIGALALKKLANKTLSTIFYVIMIIAGLKIIFG